MTNQIEEQVIDEVDDQGSYQDQVADNMETDPDGFPTYEEVETV